MVKDGNHSPKYAMFWDFENMMLAGEILNAFLKDLSILIAKLGTGKVEQLKAECYARWGLIPDATQEVLSSFGFHLIQVPKVGDNALDSLLIANMLVLGQEVTCTHFILIAADGDYCKLCADLCEKQVSVSIIGRVASFSTDYLPLPLKTYFVDKNGHLLENSIKDKAAQVKLIEVAMKDAGAALGNLQGLATNSGIQVFAYSEWEEQYKKLETPSVLLSHLLQVFPLSDFFRCFIAMRGFSASKDFAHFYCGAEGSKKEIVDLELIQKLPSLSVISTPVDPSVKLEEEFMGQPVKKADKEGEVIDLALLMQPEYIILGREVLEGLLQIHHTYKILLFDLFWTAFQQRAKELVALKLTYKQVPIEFYQKISTSIDQVKMNGKRNQWDVVKHAKIASPPIPGEFRCFKCNRKFKSAQAFANHQNSVIHQKIPCSCFKRTFISPQALAAQMKDKHKIMG